MNLARKLYQLTLGLSLAAVPMVAWAQDHPQLSEKVQRLAERDPAGGIMTFTAVLAADAGAHLPMDRDILPEEKCSEGREARYSEGARSELYR